MLVSNLPHDLACVFVGISIFNAFGSLCHHWSNLYLGEVITRLLPSQVKHGEAIINVYVYIVCIYIYIYM